MKKVLVKKGLKRNANSYRSAVGASWIATAMSAIAASRQVALAMTPECEVALLNDSAVFHGYSNLSELLTAAYAATGGAVAKVMGVADTNDTSLVLSAALSMAPGSDGLFSGYAGATASEGTAVFGWRVRLTGSLTNFSFRPLQIDVGKVTGGVGPVQTIASPVLSIAVIPRKLPVDLIVLSVANAGGLMSITAGGSGTVSGTSGTSTRNGLVVRGASDSNIYATIESLNARDLMDRSLANMRASKDAEFFEGIRDGE